MSKRRRAERLEREERRKRKRKRQRRRIFFLIAELIILSVLGVVAYGMIKLDKLNINILDRDELEVYKDTGPYTNIALFGLDSREGELEGGVQSDSIMIASINNETGDTHLLSVYRDTLLQQADGTYEKANYAYNIGGYEGAISLLNRNFDLDIQNYISVNFEAVVRAVDALGGIELEMTAEEADWCNKYAIETAHTIGDTYSGDLEVKEGTQKADGLHAVGYARIRYTEGYDFRRTQRQRIVLDKLLERAKSANFLTLNNLVDEIFPLVSTSFSVDQILGFAAHAMDYSLVDTSGFPYDVVTDDSVMNHSGSYVVPIVLADNVSRMHQNLFEEEDYVPSEKVQQISDDIIYLTGIEGGEQSLWPAGDEGDSESDEGTQ